MKKKDNYTKTVTMRIAFATLIIPILLFSCSNKNKYNTAESRLQYKFIENSGSNKLPTIGDKLLLKVKYYSAADSLIFDSREISDEFIMDFAKPTDSVPSINHAYAMMNEGDSASFKIDAEYFFNAFQKNSLPTWVKPGDKLRFEIRLEKIYSQQEFLAKEELILQELKEQEDFELQQFLETNYPKSNLCSEATSSGLYYIESKKGTGQSVAEDSYVTIHYSAEYLNGDKIYSSFEHNQPLSFYCSDESVWPGLAEGVQLMKVGGEAVMILPSELAAGIRGEGQIPPCKTILLTVHLLNIRATKVEL